VALSSPRRAASELPCVRKRRLFKSPLSGADPPDSRRSANKETEWSKSGFAPMSRRSWRRPRRSDSSRRAIVETGLPPKFSDRFPSYMLCLYKDVVSLPPANLCCNRNCAKPVYNTARVYREISEPKLSGAGQVDTTKTLHSMEWPYDHPREATCRRTITHLL